MLHQTVLMVSTPFGDGRMFQCGMADDADIRRDNFRSLWGDKFSPSAAARALWGSPSLWSDLYHGRKSFGEKIARDIEDKLDLVRLSLDDPGGPQPAPISAALAEKLQAAPAPERRKAENMLRLQFGMPLLPSVDDDSRKPSDQAAA